MRLIKWISVTYQPQMIPVSLREAGHQIEMLRIAHNIVLDTEGGLEGSKHRLIEI